MEHVKKFKTATIVMSILYILLGIILIVRPEFSALTICRLFGTIMLIPGIIRIVGFFRRDVYGNLLDFDLVYGLIFIAFGGFMLIAPKVIITALPIILGIVIIVDSIIRLQFAFNLKRLLHKKWQIHLYLALITAVLGILLVFKPFEGSIILTRFIGTV